MDVDVSTPEDLAPASEPERTWLARKAMAAASAVAARARALPDWDAWAVPFAIWFSCWGLYCLSGAVEPTHYTAHIHLAKAFLEGHFNLINPPAHFEMVTVDGLKYLVYGIGPSILMLPFVAVGGLQFHPGVFNAGCGAAAVLLWWSCLGLMKVENAHRTALTLMLALASPLWFYAGQSGATWRLMHVVTIFAFFVALRDCLGDRRGWLAGLAFGIAVLTRQTSFLTIPFFLSLLWTRGPDEIPRERWQRLALFCASCGVLFLFFAFYNYMRFGSPTDTGYTRFMVHDGRGGMGLFHPSFLATNLPLYFQTIPARLPGFPWFDPGQGGFAIWISMPWLALALFANWRDRLVMLGAESALALLVVVQFYCWTGYSQFGARYAIDMLPFAMLVAASGARQLPVQVTYVFVALGALVQFWGLWWWHLKGW